MTKHAAMALGELPSHAPDSSLPPPPNPREMWSTDEVMTLLQDERSQRAQAEQVYVAQVQQLGQDLGQWQTYAQQLQSEHAELQSQLQRVSASSGASMAPGTVPAEHAQNLELQLRAAHERISSTAAELESVRSEAQVAQQQLRLLQDHVDSVPPGASTPASFPPALDTFAAPPVPSFDDVGSEAYASPTGKGRRYSLGVLVAVAGILIASGAAAHFGVFAPQLAKERETTRQTQELMRSETERLRTQLEEQRAQTEKQVADLTKELSAAKTSIAAAQAPAASTASAAAAAPARKPAAKRRAPAKRRRVAAKRRAPKRKAHSTSHANDPIAGIGL